MHILLFREEVSPGSTYHTPCFPKHGCILLISLAAEACGRRANSASGGRWCERKMSLSAELGSRTARAHATPKPKWIYINNKSERMIRSQFKEVVNRRRSGSDEVFCNAPYIMAVQPASQGLFLITSTDERPVDRADIAELRGFHQQQPRDQRGGGHPARCLHLSRRTQPGLDTMCARVMQSLKCAKLLLVRISLSKPVGEVRCM